MAKGYWDDYIGWVTSDREMRRMMEWERTGSSGHTRGTHRTSSD